MPWFYAKDPACTHDQAQGDVVRLCPCGAVQRLDELPRDVAILGDCLQVLRGLPSNSVDASVSDPPAGIEFMGAEWDTFKQGRMEAYQGPPQGTVTEAERDTSSSFKVRMAANPAVSQRANRRCLACGHYAYSGTPCTCEEPEWAPDTSVRDTFVAFMEAVARELYRVLKPGAHGVIWAIPRTSHWTATALENAGFEIRDRIAHIFGQGFPKSLNVAKALAKGEAAMPQEQAELLAAKRQAQGWTQGVLAEELGCKEALVRLWEEGRPKKTKKAKEVSEEVEYVAPPLAMRKKIAAVLGYDQNEQRMLGLVKPKKGEVPTDAVRAQLIEQWTGWGTALKPGVEDWWLIRKPLKGSVATNVVKYGTGAMNIDGTRVGQSKRAPGGLSRTAGTSLEGSKDGSLRNETGEESGHDPNVGRWPSNLVLSHGPGCRKVGQQEVEGPLMNRYEGKLRYYYGGEGQSYTSEKKPNEQVDVYACDEGCPVAALNEQSGETTSSKPGQVVRKQAYSGYHGGDGVTGEAEVAYGDSGGASRYFQTFECEPGCPVKALDEQSGNRPATLTGHADPSVAHAHPSSVETDSWFNRGLAKGSHVYADEGGASRYFQSFEPEYNEPFLYNGKITTRERNEGFEGEVEVRAQHGMDEQTISTQSNRRCQLCGKVKMGQPHCECPEPIWEETQGSKSKNFHPTVKPVRLMRYLVRLVTPKGGTVIDPFSGSGSTLVAAIQEGAHYIGIERDPRFHRIILSRAAYATRVVQEEASQRAGFEAMLALPD